MLVNLIFFIFAKSMVKITLIPVTFKVYVKKSRRKKVLNFLGEIALRLWNQPSMLYFIT